MSVLESGGFKWVRTDDLSWRASRIAAGVLVKDVAVTDGWEMTALVDVVRARGAC